MTAGRSGPHPEGREGPSPRVSGAAQEVPRSARDEGGSHPTATTRFAGTPSDRLTVALWIVGSLVFAFIYLPLVVVILYAFHDASIIAWPFQFGTLRWFAALSHDRGMIEAALASLKLALLAVAIALLIGVPGAFVLDRYEFPGKTAFRRLVLLPLILPGIITGVSLLTFFSFVGLGLSSGFPVIPGWPVVLGHAAALTSVVITQVFARLQRLDRAQEEASQDLYANEWQTFRYVTFPNIRTAVLGAGLLVFTLSLDEIAVTFFLIGRQNTLPLQIWGLLRRGITPEVNAAATVIFALSVVVIVVWARLMREEPSS